MISDETVERLGDLLGIWPSTALGSLPEHSHNCLVKEVYKTSIGDGNYDNYGQYMAIYGKYMGNMVIYGKYPLVN